MVQKYKNIIFPVEKEKSVPQRAEFPYIAVNMLYERLSGLCAVFF